MKCVLIAGFCCHKMHNSSEKGIKIKSMQKNQKDFKNLEKSRKIQKMSENQN
jgi:hypothetical protein